MKKRILSVILTLTLCAGLSVPAFAARAFTDVPATYWAHDAIQYVVDEGLFSGTTGSTFTPGGTMTRAMLWVVLARMDGVDTSAASGEAWYQAGLDWAVEAGISDGTTPNGSITRAQFAAMLYRYAEYAGVDTAADTTELNKFADTGSIPSYAIEPLAWAVGSGIVSGTSATTISPSGSATRAQVATMLMRYSQKFGDGQTTDPGETEPEQPSSEYTLRLSAMSSTLEVGKSIVADANTTPYSARNGLTFTFSSSDPSVATVEPYSGNNFSCQITAVSPGTATITARDANGVEATLTVTVTGASTSTPGTSDGGDYADIKNEIIELTNEVRAENNAGALTKSDLLTRLAQQRADECANMGEISHVRPNGSYYSTIFEENGLDRFEMQYVEILGWSTILDAKYIVDMWENSPGHFASMTGTNKTLVGVGISLGDDGRFYFCQIFTNKD